MAFGNNDDNDNEIMSEINMTPLVDVMLVLLIIFMITVPVLSHSVKLELPRAKSASSAVKPDTVTISIKSDGSIYWNTTPMDEAALEQQLRVAAQRSPQPEVHIHGDRKSQYEHVIRAMSAAQRAGINKLGFATDPGQKGS